MSESARTYLECPCCGDDGAESDADGLFYDGQPLRCGCAGCVSVDGDGDESWAWINNGDAPCPPDALCHETGGPQ